MSLDNLVGRTLERVEPERAGIARMLAAAERNIADAGLAALSVENRFDAAYKAILQCAMVRNLADYEGEPVTEQSAAECLAQARQLLADVKGWLKANKPALAG